jgi:hypothetical protein
MKILRLFINPPIAIARLGATAIPQPAFSWTETPDPHSTADTTSAPDWSLELQTDCTIEPFKPTSIQFRDGGRNQTQKSKNFPNREETRTIQAMNCIIQFEDEVSCSRSKREGESSQDVCDRLDLTRGDSLRQLPTDHDYAVSTREYQLDQSSPLPASAAADPVFERQ